MDGTGTDGAIGMDATAALLACDMRVLAECRVCGDSGSSPTKLRSTAVGHTSPAGREEDDMIWAWTTVVCFVAAAGLGRLFVVAALGSASEGSLETELARDELDD